MLLFIIAFVLLLPTIVVSYVHLLFQGRAKGYWRQLAVDIDIFGNRAFRSLWNVMFIKNLPQVPLYSYRFGRWGETISSVLGKNKQRGTLTAVGKAMCAILDFIDPNHCIKSIMSEEDLNNNNYFHD